MNKQVRKYISILSDNLDYLKTTYHVKKVGIFGSTVNGQPTKKSDIDILVDFFQPISFFKFIELEDLLSKKFNKKADLITTKALKPTIKKDVLKYIIYV